MCFKENLLDYANARKTSQMIFKKLRIFREDKGIIIVMPVEEKISEEIDANVEVANAEDMKMEIELLRKRLTAMNYLKEENEALRQCQEETALLR